MKRPPRRGRPFRAMVFELSERQFQLQARVCFEVQDPGPPRVSPVVKDLIRGSERCGLAHVLRNGDGRVVSASRSSCPVLRCGSGTDNLAIDIEVQARTVPIDQFGTCRCAIPQYNLAFVFTGSIEIVRRRVVIHGIRIRATVNLTPRQRQGRNHQNQPPRSRIELAHFVLNFETGASYIFLKQNPVKY